VCKVKAKGQGKRENDRLKRERTKRWKGTPLSDRMKKKKKKKGGRKEKMTVPTYEGACWFGDQEQGEWGKDTGSIGKGVR